MVIRYHTHPDPTPVHPRYPELLEDAQALKNTASATTALADKVLAWKGPKSKSNESLAAAYLEILRDLEGWRPYQLARLGLLLGTGKLSKWVGGGWGGVDHRQPRPRAATDRQHQKARRHSPVLPASYRPIVLASRPSPPTP